jgi:sucrose phosphorylase
MKEIRENIKFLYPDHDSEVTGEINKIVSYYKKRISSEQFDLTSNDLILIAYADSFNDKNETCLQTFKKVCDEYLKTIINSVHILPFYPSTSDDGFAVIDYKKVDPEFGDWDDIENLGKSFHLMFDAVINHISKSSGWFQGFLNGDPEYKKFFIECKPEDPDLKKVIRPRALPLLHCYEKRNRQKTFVWTTFSEDQVDLNYQNPKVFLEILDVLLFYISKGAKFIRLDAVAFLWKAPGTNCIHLEQTHKIIQTYRALIDSIAPQTVIITETNVPHDENISYFGNGYNEAHMVYNFSLPPLLAYSLHKENIEILTRWARSLKLPSNKTCFFNFTASHDGIGVRPLQGIIPVGEIDHLAKITEEHGGFVSYKSNPDGSKSPYELNCNYMDFLTDPLQPDEKRAQRFLLSQSVMISMPGVPGIYYHSVFGSENDVQGVVDSGINRRINREKIACEDLKKNLNNPLSLRYKIYHRYMDLLKIRMSERAFNPFGEAKFYNGNNVFIIERIYEGQTIYCIHNFTHEEKNIERFSQGTVDLISREKEVRTLNAFEFRWLKKE